MDRETLELEKLQVEIQKGMAETRKLIAERNKLIAETVKLEEEAQKIRNDKEWGPFIAGATSLTAIGALVTAFYKLFHPAG